MAQQPQVNVGMVSENGCIYIAQPYILSKIQQWWDDIPIFRLLKWSR